jgi:hypothetical protein
MIVSDRLHEPEADREPETETDPETAQLVESKRER